MGAADRPHQSDPGAERAAHPEPLLGPALSASRRTDRFAVVQVEVPWPLGPADGRYVLRDGPDRDGISHVLVLGTVGVTRRGRGAPVASGRATIVAARTPLGDEAAARAWLEHAGEDELERALRALARLLHAHRLATADPAPAAVTRDRLTAARVGFADGDDAAAGRLSTARELAVADATPHAPRRRGSLHEARLGALLAGRQPPLACEELVLRARLDLDEDRPREAALQLLVALDAALVELSADPQAGTLRTRIDELRGRRDDVAEAAQAALSGPPSSAQRTQVAETVARIEAALRARAAALGA